MRILGIGDLHGWKGFIDDISRQISEADVVVLAGDITQHGGPTEALEICEKIGSPDKVAAVPGNLDSQEIAEALNESGYGLHGVKRKIGGVLFSGFGGSNPTPYNTPFELSEEKIKQGLEKVAEPGCVLLTHVPPLNTQADKVYTGVSGGSSAVRQIIEEKQPMLSLSAHIHESQAVDKIGQTIVVNVGPASRGKYATIDTDTKKVKLF